MAFQSFPCSQVLSDDFLTLDELAATETWTEFDESGGKLKRLLNKLTFGLFYNASVHYSVTFLGRDTNLVYVNKRLLGVISNWHDGECSETYTESFMKGNSGSVTFTGKWAHFEAAAEFSYTEEYTVDKTICIVANPYTECSYWISDIVVATDEFDYSENSDSQVETVVEYCGQYYLEVVDSKYYGY